MRTAMTRQTTLLERLPAVRGRLSEGASLAKVTWFRVGGPAEVLFKPADVADLQSFLAGCPADVAITVLGVGSNLLVRDGGIPGVVIRLGRAFAEIRTEGQHVYAGAAALDLNVALAARGAGIAGLEFLSGIPGTIGGACRMNAGAYGNDLSQVLVTATALDRAGNLHRLDKDYDGLHLSSQRRCGRLDLLRGGACRPCRRSAAIQQRLNEIQAAREESQPVRARTGGSTFVNPTGQKAWALVDAAGCRGLAVGGAMVSEKHCDFLINTGGASAADHRNPG